MFGGEFPGEALIPRLVHRARAADPGPARRAVHRAHHAGGAAEAHPVPRPGQDQRERGRLPASCRCTPRRPVASSSSCSASPTLLAAVAQINPIWAYGPVRPVAGHRRLPTRLVHGLARGGDPAHARLAGVPGVRLDRSASTSPSAALILPGIVTTVALIYPFLEAWVTGDKREHHLLDRPRNAPTRTGLGAMRSRSTACCGSVAATTSSPPTSSCRSTTSRTSCGSRSSWSRRSSSWSPSGSAWGCSAATASWCCTASRPAAWSGCRTASSSRCTSRWTSTPAGSSCSTTRTVRCLRPRPPTSTACARRACVGRGMRAKLSQLLVRGPHRGRHAGRAGCGALARRARRRRGPRRARCHREQLVRGGRRHAQLIHLAPRQQLRARPHRGGPPAVTPKPPRPARALPVGQPAPVAAWATRQTPEHPHCDH